MSFPYGYTVTLQQPVKDVRCWNFITDTRFEFPAGTKFLLERVYDTTHTTCMLRTDEEDQGGRAGIELFYEGKKGESVQQRGYRFIIPNPELAHALGASPPPVPTRDIIGEILQFENGELGTEEARSLLIHLHDTGLLFSLQGCYQRAYQRLVLEN